MNGTSIGARGEAGAGREWHDAARGVRLSAGSPVSLRGMACLRTRLYASACRECVDACPVGSLVPGSEGVETAGGACTGCGRCQAACPMGALAVDGFEGVADEASAARTDVLLVDCLHAGSAAAEIRVPCLGGLSEGALLSLCAKAPQRTVMLVDAGKCGACDSGGDGAHPAAHTLHRVVELMREAGVPDERLPRFAAAPGRGAARAARNGDPLQSRGRARRGFFTALARAASAPPPAPRSAVLSVPSPERRSTIDALQALAARHGGRLPGALFHRLEVGAACDGHRVCAPACPTGALVRYREDAAGRMGIAFDGAACIGCGHCAAVCPQQALQLQLGRGEAGAGHRPLTRFMQRECVHCGARFASRANDDETRCERCRKSAHLARAAFASLFPARPRLRDTE